MPMTWGEMYQRRVDTMEWTPLAMTEEERLQHRRFEAYFAFEQGIYDRPPGIPTWDELQYRLLHCDECYCHYDRPVPRCGCECHP